MPNNEKDSMCYINLVFPLAHDNNSYAANYGNLGWVFYDFRIFEGVPNARVGNTKTRPLWRDTNKTISVKYHLETVLIIDDHLHQR